MPFKLIKGNEVGIHQVKHIFSSEMLQIEIHPDHPDRQHDLIRPGRLRWTRRWSNSDRRSAAGFTRLDWTATSIDSPLTHCLLSWQIDLDRKSTRLQALWTERGIRFFGSFTIYVDQSRPTEHPNGRFPEKTPPIPYYVIYGQPLRIPWVLENFRVRSNLHKSSIFHWFLCPQTKKKYRVRVPTILMPQT